MSTSFRDDQAPKPDPSRYRFERTMGRKSGVIVEDLGGGLSRTVTRVDSSGDADRVLKRLRADETREQAA